MSKIKFLSKTKLRFRQLTYRLKHDFLSVENIVLVGAVFLCAFLTIQSVISMSRNWELVEKLSSSERQLALLKVEVEAAELENDYYRTTEYQELAARKFLNKKLDGENLVYLPANSTSAKDKHKVAPIVAEEKAYSNPEKWFLFLFPNS